MNICTTSQFMCSLKFPETRLRTLHNIICYPETFLCKKHMAVLEGVMDGRDYLFYAAITRRGTQMVREAVMCNARAQYCDIGIVEDEIVYSGLSTGSSPLIMESKPEGTRLSEAIYTYTRSRLLGGLEEFKAHLKQLDISHNNLDLSNIIVDSNHTWHSIHNYNLTQGYGGDKDNFATIERNIDNLGIPDKPTPKSLEQLRLYSITVDSDGNTIYPIVEACRRFTSKRGVGFRDKNDKIIINDEYLWASDFSSNRAVVQLKSGKMGIIDRKGRYIIPPLYSSISYNSMNGISIVHDGERQTLFNYLGEQIEEWH